MRKLVLTLATGLVVAAATVTAVAVAAGPEGAKANLDKYKKVPTFVAPGPAFDAKDLAGGKKIFIIPASSQIPFVSTISNHMKRIAALAGVKTTIWQNQGQPSQWVQGMNAAIAQKANAIVLLAGNDPAGLQPQIKAAKAKGIPTIVAHLYDDNQKSAPNVGGLVNIPYNIAGQLIADQAIVDTKGKANALVVTINQVKSTVPMVAGIKSQFAKFCAGCKLTFTDVTIADVATKIQPNVQSALTGGPGHQLRDLPLRLGGGAVRLGGDPCRGPHRQGQDLDLQRHARDPQGGQEGRHHHDGRRPRTSSGSATRSSTSRCGSWAACRP